MSAASPPPPDYFPAFVAYLPQREAAMKAARQFIELHDPTAETNEVFVPVPFAAPYNRVVIFITCEQGPASIGYQYTRADQERAEMAMKAANGA